jgi:hypothetical protein
MPNLRTVKEADIQAAVLKAARKHPAIGRVFRVNSGTFKSFAGSIVQGAPKGTPDLIGFMADGRFLAVEIKVPGEFPTPEQRAFIADLNACGGLGFVATSVDSFLRFLAETVTMPTDGRKDQKNQE